MVKQITITYPALPNPLPVCYVCSRDGAAHLRFGRYVCGSCAEQGDQAPERDDYYGGVNLYDREAEW